MEFRLIYQGLLLAESQKGGLLDARATHKQEIRKSLHPQLKRLWEINPYLIKGKNAHPPEALKNKRGVELGAPKSYNTLPALADRYSRFGYRFVPLVTREMELLCAIEVLFLRTDPPGSLISAGDIDNRLKTLFDGLIVPREAGQIGKYTTPGEGEDPFFCLLEDDSLITKVSVETDTLLAPTSNPPDQSDARVIMTVRIKPFSLRADTIGFG